MHDQCAERANIMERELHEKERLIIDSCHSNSGRNFDWLWELRIWQQRRCIC